MSNGPGFLFPGDTKTLAGSQLTGADAWLTGPDQSGEYEHHGLPSLNSGDPYTVIDEFFDRFDGGIIAGWLSYELVSWNHDLPEPSPPEHALPLLCLAHFSDWSETESATKPAARLGSFEPVEDQNRYERGVRRIQEAIRRGDVYQVNLSQRFETGVNGSLRTLLDNTDDQRIPPHSVYGSLGEHEILSLSPERFLRVEGDIVRTQPIKGTRARGETPHEDDRRREELLRSGKDRAEHAMIVDLERNDLNRVCKPGSVRVPELIVHRRFPTVHHLVSTVEGRLREDVSPGELFRRTFPGGSITGAPKHTAVRLIDRLENRHRGLYTGTMGYWDLDRDVADWNIAIRTLVRHEDRAWWDSGGGIVIDSDPADEYSESLDKVALIRRLSASAESPVDQVRSGGGLRGSGGLV